MTEVKHVARVFMEEGSEGTKRVGEGQENLVQITWTVGLGVGT